MPPRKKKKKFGDFTGKVVGERGGKVFETQTFEKGVKIPTTPPLVTSRQHAIEIERTRTLTPEERKTLGLLPGERAGGGFDPRAPSRTGARFQDFEGAKFRREAQAFEEFKRQQGQKVSISGQQEITPFPDTQELIKPEETILPEVQAQKEAEKVGLGDQILRIINLPLELFVKDTAAVIPVTAGEEGTAEFDPEKALKLTRRVVTGAAIGNFGILNKFLSGLPGSVKQIVIGIIGASGLTQWLAADNIATGTGITSGKVATSVETGVLTAEEGLAQLEALESKKEDADTFTIINTAANPFMWPFRNMFITNSDVAQANLDNARQRIEVIAGGGTQQQQFFDIIQKEKLAEEQERQFREAQG